LLPYYLEIIELESSTKFLLDRQLELYNEKWNIWNKFDLLWS
jgi:hypothetical protein